jgi:hypothetical protein
VANDGYYVKNEVKHFDSHVREKIIKTAKELIGRPYSWWTIYQNMKNYCPFIRLCRKECKNGEIDTKTFVCSTLVTYSYRINFIDPVPFLCDCCTVPGDLARSRLFFKLFSVY